MVSKKPPDGRPLQTGVWYEKIEDTPADESPGDLGSALDALNEEFGRVEDWMSEQGFVSGAVPMPSGGSLYWGRFEGSRALVDVPVVGGARLLVTSSATRRLEAVGQLPALVERFTAVAGAAPSASRVREVTRALTEIRAVAQTTETVVLDVSRKVD